MFNTESGQVRLLKQEKPLGGNGAPCTKKSGCVSEEFMSKKGRRLKQNTQSRCVHCGEAKRIFQCSMRRVVLSPTLTSLLCV